MISASSVFLESGQMEKRDGLHDDGHDNGISRYDGGRHNNGSNGRPKHTYNPCICLIAHPITRYVFLSNEKDGFRGFGEDTYFCSK